MADELLNQRIAEARTPEEAEAILGKRRMATYSVVCAATALGLLAINVYIVVDIATGREGVWTAGWLLALLPLFLFAGLITYADLYKRITGRRINLSGVMHGLDALNRNL